MSLCPAHAQEDKLTYIYLLFFSLYFSNKLQLELIKLLTYDLVLVYPRTGIYTGLICTQVDLTRIHFILDTHVEVEGGRGWRDRGSSEGSWNVEEMELEKVEFQMEEEEEEEEGR